MYGFSLNIQNECSLSFSTALNRLWNSWCSEEFFPNLPAVKTFHVAFSVDKLTLLLPGYFGLVAILT